MFTLYFADMYKYFKPELMFSRDPFFTISIYTSYEFVILLYNAFG